MQQGDIAGRQWHLDKRVNVGHLLTTLALAVAFGGAWSAQNERISRLEERVHQQSATAVREAQAIRDTLLEVKGEIRQMRELLINQIQRNGRQSSPGY